MEEWVLRGRLEKHFKVILKKMSSEPEVWKFEFPEKLEKMSLKVEEGRVNVQEKTIFRDRKKCVLSKTTCICSLQEYYIIKNYKT